MLYLYKQLYKAMKERVNEGKGFAIKINRPEICSILRFYYLKNETKITSYIL